jgi:hypothetical protein
MVIQFLLTRHGGIAPPVRRRSRSCHSRSLGGRSVARGAQQPRGHAGRASFAFCHAGEGAQQRYGCCNCCSEPARLQAARDAAALVNLGPWVGDGATQEQTDWSTGRKCGWDVARSARARPDKLFAEPNFLWGGRPLDQLDARAPRVSDVCERNASRLVLADWFIELDALRFDLLDEGL